MTPDALLEQFLPLARSIARGWSRSYPRLADDLFSDALVALWKASQTFRSHDGTVAGFATYARVAITRTLSATVRRQKRTVPVVDHDPDLVGTEQDLDALHDVGVMLEKLTPVRREVAEMLLDGHSLSEIADARGVSPQAVSAMVGRMICSQPLG